MWQIVRVAATAPRRVRAWVRRRRRGVFAAFVALLGVAVGLASWQVYGVATEGLPHADWTGGVGVYLDTGRPGGEPPVEARLTVTRDHRLARLEVRLPAGAAPGGGSCVRYLVGVAGGAAPEPGRAPPGWQRGIPGMVTRGSACPGADVADDDTARVRSGRVDWVMARPAANRHGTGVAVSAPTVAVERVPPEYFPDLWDAFEPDRREGGGSVVSFPVRDAVCDVDLGAVPATERVETASPDLAGPGLRWVGCEQSPVALLTSLPAEARADRALFWAGLLSGAAVSLVLLAAEIGFVRQG